MTAGNWRRKQGFPPRQLEIVKKHLKVRGVYSRIETWQPGKVKLNKLNKNITHPAVTNYWTPLYVIDDNKPTRTEEEINIPRTHKQPPKPTLNKWKWRIA